MKITIENQGNSYQYKADGKVLDKNELNDKIQSENKSYISVVWGGLIVYILVIFSLLEFLYSQETTIFYFEHYQ